MKYLSSILLLLVLLFGCASTQKPPCYGLKGSIYETCLDLEQTRIDWQNSFGKNKEKIINTYSNSFAQIGYNNLQQQGK